MRLPTSSIHRSPLRFNITPMIDVVFLLIIFFLVASYFIRSEQSRDVALPEAVSGKADDAASNQRLTITVEADGRLSVAGQLLPESEVMARIKELDDATEPGSLAPEVRIRTDRATRFGSVRSLIEACAANGIGRIRFAVVAPETSEPSSGSVEP